jgi:hypothetical protein
MEEWSDGVMEKPTTPSLQPPGSQRTARPTPWPFPGNSQLGGGRSVASSSFCLCLSSSGTLVFFQEINTIL